MLKSKLLYTVPIMAAIILGLAGCGGSERPANAKPPYDAGVECGKLMTAADKAPAAERGRKKLEVDRKQKELIMQYAGNQKDMEEFQAGLQDGLTQVIQSEGANSKFANLSPYERGVAVGKLSINKGGLEGAGKSQGEYEEEAQAGMMAYAGDKKASADFQRGMQDGMSGAAMRTNVDLDAFDKAFKDKKAYDVGVEFGRLQTEIQALPMDQRGAKEAELQGFRQAAQVRLTGAHNVTMLQNGEKDGKKRFSVMKRDENAAATNIANSAYDLGIRIGKQMKAAKTPAEKVAAENEKQEVMQNLTERKDIEFFNAGLQAAGSEEAAPSDVSAEPVVTSYTVKAGDTLTKIANEVLGSKDRWKDIKAANPDLDVTKPLTLGLVLKMPAK